MILVTGVTGNIGGPLVRRLVEGRHAVRGMARDVTKAKAALGPDVSVVHGDFRRGDTLSTALMGVTKAFFVSNAGPDLAETGGVFVEAAKAAGVKHIVAISSGTIAIEPPVAIGRWHLALERRLKASGLAWTMLRPGNFASNTLRWAPTIRAQGAVFGAHGDATTAPIDPRDIAAVAFEALTRPEHDGKTYVLTGSQELSTRDQVDKIAKALNKAVRFVEVPEERARAGMIASGMPETMAEAIMELVREGARVGGSLRTTTVRDVTGRDPRSFDDWLHDSVAAFF